MDYVKKVTTLSNYICNKITTLSGLTSFFFTNYCLNSKEKLPLTALAECFLKEN